jgi:hypothetical protein
MEANLQVIALDSRHLAVHQAFETTDAVMVMYDVVTRAQVPIRFPDVLWLLAPASPVRTTPSGDLAFSDNTNAKLR